MSESTESKTGPSSGGEAGPASRSEASGDIAAEIHAFGKNLIELVQTAWESEERKKLQDEIETGLKEAGDSLSRAAAEFKDSPTGQRLSTEAKEFQSRVRSGEVATSIREDLLAVLRKINAELEKAMPGKDQPPENQE